MEPLTDCDQNPSVFDVERAGDDSWLGTDYGNANDVWDPGVRCVFGRG